MKKYIALFSVIILTSCGTSETDTVTATADTTSICIDSCAVDTVLTVADTIK